MTEGSSSGDSERNLPRLCVLVPCYNEEESIPVLVEKLVPALENATGGSWRILFIDDGSTDTTAQFIWSLHEKDARFGGIRLTRNFGHQPALATGIKFAEGQYIGVIDCDLQDPVDVLLQLYQKVSGESYDVCAGRREQRDEVPLWLRAAYKTFYRVMATIAEHDFVLDSGDFCVFNRRVHHALLALPERMQVLRGLRSWVGFKQTSIAYRRPPRRHGRSKYNVKRLVQLGLKNIVSFSILPLRFATCLGLGMVLLIAVATVFFLINRFVPSFAPLGYRISENAGTTTLVIYGSLIAAALFLCLGIMGEYLALVVQEVKRRPSAVVADATPSLRNIAPGSKNIGPF